MGRLSSALTAAGMMVAAFALSALVLSPGASADAASFSLEPVTPLVALISPGAVDLVANVTNLGDTDVNLTFTATGPAGWGATPPDNVTLTPGESRNVTLSFTSPANVLPHDLTLSAMSIDTPGAPVDLVWHVVEPVDATVVITQSTYHAQDDVRGYVHLTWHNGAPVRGIPTRITDYVDDFGQQFRSWQDGVTDNAGNFVFDYDDPLGEATTHIPGGHTLVSTSKLVETISATRAYTTEI